MEMEAHRAITRQAISGDLVGCYGNGVIRAISAASRTFFDNPPPGFVTILSWPTARTLRSWRSTVDDWTISLPSRRSGLLERIDPLAVLEMVPVLNAEAVTGAAYERDAQDIDANAFLMGYLKGFRDAGGIRAELKSEPYPARRRMGNRSISGDYVRPIVVTPPARGDEVAYRAGTQPVGQKASNGTDD